MDITIEPGGGTTVQVQSGETPDITIEQGGTLEVDVETTASAPYIYVTDNAATDPVIATLPNGTLIFQRSP